MSKTINLYYKKLPNMGDLLNPLIVKNVFGLNSKHNTFLTCELSGIGSGLESFLLSEKSHKRFLQAISYKFLGEVHIWGTGFLRENINESYFYRKSTVFHAVRGELSKSKVEKILKRKLNIPTGDPGLLASYLIKEKIEKKYALGIIPHFREQDNRVFDQIRKLNRNSKIIDLKEDPIEVVKQIAQCEVVISSSLHGLIVADSFDIPNQHFIVSDKLKGDGFKFRDYYSSYHLEHKPVDIKNSSIPTINNIIDSYEITRQMVEDKKKDIINSFPFDRKLNI